MHYSVQPRDHIFVYIDEKGKVNFKIYDVTTWLKDNFNTNRYLVR